LCLGDTFGTTVYIGWKDDIRYWRRIFNTRLFTNSFFIRQAAKTTLIKIDDDLPIQDTSTVFATYTTLPSARVFPVLSPSHIKKIFFYTTTFTHFFQIRFDSVLQHLILDPGGSIPPYNTFLLWIFFPSSSRKLEIVTHRQSSRKEKVK